MKRINNCCPIQTSRKCHLTHPQVTKDPFITLWYVFPTSLAPIYESYHFSLSFLTDIKYSFVKNFSIITAHNISELSTLNLTSLPQKKTKLYWHLFLMNPRWLILNLFPVDGHIFHWYTSEDNRKNESVSFCFINKYKFSRISPIFHHFLKKKKKNLHSFYQQFFKYFKVIFVTFSLFEAI